MNLVRTNESINGAEDAGTAHVKIRFSDALRRVLPTRLTSYLEFGGRICQETLCDRSSVTFDLRQCDQHPQGRPERGGPYLEKIPCPRLSWVNLGPGISATER